MDNPYSRQIPDKAKISFRMKNSSLSASLQQCTPRQRTAIACRYCRRRKIRCSGFENADDGRCLNCQRFSQDCVFTPVSSHNSSFSAISHGIGPANHLQARILTPLHLSNGLDPQLYRLPPIPTAFDPYHWRNYQNHVGFHSWHPYELMQRTTAEVDNKNYFQSRERREGLKIWPHFERTIGIHGFLPLPDEHPDICTHLPRVSDSRCATDKFMLEMLKPRKGL